ncbi:MAG: hypothetical protein AABZ06_03700 [Bdellovibrionota bacterium]
MAAASTIFFALTLLCHTTAATTTAGRMKAPDFTVALNQQSGAIMVTATAPAKHHFNLKAPMYVQTSVATKVTKPSLSTRDKVKFKLPAKKLTGVVTVSLYLCDERKTFCENHVVTAR